MAANLPVIDVSAPDRSATANSIREACINYGFFYAVNHGVEPPLLDEVLSQSRNFFSLPLHTKSNYARSNLRGFTALFAENFDPSSSSIGDPKESFFIGSMIADHLNQWPSELPPNWKTTMEAYYNSALSSGKNLISLIALSLGLEETHFEKIGALNTPQAFIRLLHYPSDWVSDETENCSKREVICEAHSDYGMLTLLISDGVAGLQCCRDKDRSPRLWEDVAHLEGAFIVNVGDMLERWTNCLFRSTLHRVVGVGEERFSVAFFIDSDPDCVVDCLETCCSASRPKRFPPIRGGDYLKERLAYTYKL